MTSPPFPLLQGDSGGGYVTVDPRGRRGKRASYTLVATHIEGYYVKCSSTGDTCGRSPLCATS